MELVNIEKLPPRAQAALRPVVEELVTTHGRNLLSIFAYGSVTGPDYSPGASDINLGVALKEVTMDALKLSLKTVRKALRRKITAPLFLTPSYISMSLDSFPIEFADMKDTRLVIFGEDVLSGIEVKKEDLRRECEYQIKGKLLMLRQAYLERALDPRGLEKLAKISFRSLFPVFKGALRIKLMGAAPQRKEEVLVMLEREFGVEVSSFSGILRDRRNDGKIAGRDAEKVLADLLAALEKLCDAVDRM